MASKTKFKETEIGRIPEDWNIYKLSDIIEIIGGGTPKTSVKEYWGGNIFWLSVVDFNNDNRLVRKTEKTITEKGLKESSTKILKKGYIIISARGTVGEISQLAYDMAFNQSCYGLNGKKPIINDFLYYLLKNSIKDLKKNAHGSVFDTITRNTFDQILVSIPSIEEQKSISEVLTSLDDKIELNNQINQTLEAMAQAIFKSWFVDFEPVKAKIAAIEAGEDAEGVTRAAMRAISGKTGEELDQLQAEQPENYTQLKTTAELFPAAMQDSELGKIPEGWVVRTLGSLLIELRRGISPKYTDEDGILVINQKCIRDHSVNFLLARRNDTELRTVKGRELQVGDILVNSTGVGTLGRLAPIRYLPEPAVVDSHVTVIRASEEVSPLFINEYMLTKESFIEASGAGSTGQTELGKTVLEELFVVVPNRILIDLFEIILKPISSFIAEKEQECQSLSQLRDILLPKLLSGELEVNDINEAES